MRFGLLANCRFSSAAATSHLELAPWPQYARERRARAILPEQVVNCSPSGPGDLALAWSVSEPSALRFRALLELSELAAECRGA